MSLQQLLVWKTSVINRMTWIIGCIKYLRTFYDYIFKSIVTSSS